MYVSVSVSVFECVCVCVLLLCVCWFDHFLLQRLVVSPVRIVVQDVTWPRARNDSSNVASTC
jgi:hypothetical protein